MTMVDDLDTDEIEETKDIWQLLEETAPVGCSDVQDLYSWSLNYDAGKGPFTLFLDLIGYSEDNFGETMFDLTSAALGYLELSKLADALQQYTDAPSDVNSYVVTLMDAEAR